MKKLTIVLFALIFLAGCRKDFETGPDGYPVAWKYDTQVMPKEHDIHPGPYKIRGIYFRDHKNNYYNVIDRDSFLIHNYPDYSLREVK